MPTYMPDLSVVSDTLARHGFRLTRQRRAVLGVIAAAQTRMSPAEVHAAARDSCPDLGLATVYRTLELLHRLGVIRRVHMNDHCDGFAPAALHEDHHVVCLQCGRVAEFQGCNVASLIPLAVRQTGFQVEEHFLELMGTCGECRERGHGASPSRLPSRRRRPS